MSETKHVLVARIPPEGVSAYQEYETSVLPLLAEHQGTLERRLRSSDGLMEVHVVGFASPEGFTAYMDDPRRVALQPLLLSSGAHTDLYEMDNVPSARPPRPKGPTLP